MPNNNKANHLYVFVKGHKGKGAFEITDAEYQFKHSDSVEEVPGLAASSMDLRAIERSLEFIKDNRGKKGVPDEPVISIFTTYENNYHVASGLKKPRTEERVKFKQALEKLQTELERPGQKQHDEIKCYWVPDDFENHFDDVKKILDGDDS